MSQQVKKRFGFVFFMENAIFLILCVMAVIFFKERLFTDSGYYLFHVVNNESFRIEHSRLVLAFSQILPLIGVKLGLSLKTIVILYSLNHVFFFYFSFLISKFYLKVNYSGLVFIGFQTIGTATSYFVPMFELMYISVILFFVFILLDKRNSISNLLIFSLLVVLAEFSHFYSTFIIGAYLIYHFFEGKQRPLKSYFTFIIISILVYLVKQSFQSEYDAGKMMAFINNLKFAKYDLIYIKGLVAFLFEYYKELILMFLTMVTVLIFNKKYLAIIWTSLPISLLLIMVNLSNYGFESSRYQEQVYIPLIIIITIFFFRIVFEDKRKFIANIGIGIFIILVFSRLATIYKASDEFTARTNAIERLVEKCNKNTNSSKFVVSETDLKSKSNWSYPVESLLLSAMNGHSNHCVSICTIEDIDFENNRSKLNQDNFLFRRWEIMDDNSLNPDYFKICHGNYQTITP